MDCSQAVADPEFFHGAGSGVADLPNIEKCWSKKVGGAKSRCLWRENRGVKGVESGEGA
jgi:hypothetical protein